MTDFSQDETEAEKERRESEREREKKEKDWEHKQRAISEMWKGDATILEDIKKEQEGTKEKFNENFMQIDEVERCNLIQLAIKTKNELNSREKKGNIDGDKLMRIILDQTDDILRRAEAGYVIKVMINKGFIKHIEEKNLPLSSSEQIYEIL
jgi:hypothetical protein